jgi:hypothetical protein
MKEKFSFLGRGWSFPPQFSKELKTVLMTEDEEDIIKSLEILLSTRQGERVMLPGYGCNLNELLFKSLDLTLKTYITDQIKTSILYHEPRIDVIKVSLDESDPVQGLVMIKIEFIVRKTNSRKNMVYPFYKNEGSEIN